MYRNGSVVTLAVAKEHGDGENALRLAVDTCGMIVEEHRATDGNHRYIVDFGAYGQWHCTHNELHGDDAEGWEVESRETAPREEGRDSELVFEAPLISLSEDGEIEQLPTPMIDVEADIKRRIKELEKGR